MCEGDLRETKRLLGEELEKNTFQSQYVGTEQSDVDGGREITVEDGGEVVGVGLGDEMGKKTRLHELLGEEILKSKNFEDQLLEEVARNGKLEIELDSVSKIKLDHQAEIAGYMQSVSDMSSQFEGLKKENSELVQRLYQEVPSKAQAEFDAQENCAGLLETLATEQSKNLRQLQLLNSEQSQNSEQIDQYQSEQQKSSNFFSITKNLQNSEKSLIENIRNLEIENFGQQTQIQTLQTENSTLANVEISVKDKNESSALENLLKDYEAVVLFSETKLAEADRTIQTAHFENSDKTDKIESLRLELSEATLDLQTLATLETEKADLTISLGNIQKIWEDKQKEFEQNEIYCQEAIADFEKRIIDLEGQKNSIDLDRKIGLQQIETLQGEIHNLDTALEEARGKEKEQTANVELSQRADSVWVTFQFFKRNIERKVGGREIETQRRKSGSRSEIIEVG